MSLRSTLAKRAFSPKVRLRLWKKLATQIRHGMDLGLTLRKQRDRAGNRRSPLADVYAAILGNLAAGHSLGASLTGFAPAEEIMLISGGQRSGQLPESLLLAAGLIEAGQRIRGAMRNALAYPAFLLCLVLVLLLVVSGYVVPRLAAISDPATWGGAARALYLVASFVASSSGIVALIVLGLLLALVAASMPRWTGRLRLKADRVPPWSIYRLTVGAVWLFTLATLMRSGKSVNHILDDMLESETVSPWLKERISAISVEYDQGKNLGEAMVDAGTGFPDSEIVEDLRDYAVMPEFHQRLHEIAEEWLKEGVELIERQAAMLRIGCILLIIAIVCGMLLAMGSLQQQLSTTVGGY